jgi:type IV pilus assembly protein PilY1
MTVSCERVNGNRADAYDGVAAGKEIWSFIPPEFYGSIKRLRDNDITISYTGNEVTEHTPLPKPYGMDGAITAYEKSSLFVGMRRGGRALYAFNISNIVGDPDAEPAVAPEAPRMLWKVGCPNLANDDELYGGLRGHGPDLVIGPAVQVRRICGTTPRSRRSPC